MWVCHCTASLACRLWILYSVVAETKVLPRSMMAVTGILPCFVVTVTVILPHSMVAVTGVMAALAHLRSGWCLRIMAGRQRSRVSLLSSAFLFCLLLLYQAAVAPVGAPLCRWHQQVVVMTLLCVPQAARLLQESRAVCLAYVSAGQMRADAMTRDLLMVVLIFLPPQGTTSCPPWSTPRC